MLKKPSSSSLIKDLSSNLTGSGKISALKKPGVGNPAMGSVFKSVYLCQGRNI